MTRKASSKPSNTTANLGFEQDMAGFVLANGSMSSNQSVDCHARSAMTKPKAKPQSLPRQRDIRRALIEADLVDCMVALPGQLFYSTQIPVCLWFLRRDRSGRPPSSPALLPKGEGRKTGTDRRKQTLFIDARKMETLMDRVHRELTDGAPFEEKMPRLVAELHAQFAESAKLESQIRANLKGLGFGVCP